ncbi:hypothetical protein HCH52_08375 [Oscillospiraceae bacterium HV4-5-C5C]|nr:hypothetical protein [Oscillospiraceae bacterium HV4-5-C5C]
MAEELNTTLTPEVPAKEKRANPRVHQTAGGKPGGNRQPDRRRGQSPARPAAGGGGGHFRERRPASGQAAPKSQPQDNSARPRPSRQRSQGRGPGQPSRAGQEARRSDPQRHPASQAKAPAAAEAQNPAVVLTGLAVETVAVKQELEFSAQTGPAQVTPPVEPAKPANPAATDPAVIAAGFIQPREARSARRLADRDLRRQTRSHFDHQIKAEENAEDIRIDNLQIEKEIQLELAEIRTLSLD